MSRQDDEILNIFWKEINQHQQQTFGHLNMMKWLRKDSDVRFVFLVTSLSLDILIPVASLAFKYANSMTIVPACSFYLNHTSIAFAVNRINCVICSISIGALWYLFEALAFAAVFFVSRGETFIMYKFGY